jgi:hypothetical protein
MYVNAAHTTASDGGRHLIILFDLPMAEQDAAADAWKTSVVPQDHYTCIGIKGKNKVYDCNWCHQVVQGTSRCVDHLCGKLATRSGLVFAFTNMRLVEKMLSPAGEEFVGWDEEEQQEESESDAGEGAE